MTEQSFSGGCQCGAVRYRFTEKPAGAHVCHCRMCQKAFGNFYAPLVGGPAETFEITRGELGIYRSSAHTMRGFCADCGTPLTLTDDDSTYMSVSIGSLDHPEDFPPLDQHGVESRHDFVNGIGQLPDVEPTEVRMSDVAPDIAASNNQHPDYDTETWSPKGGDAR